MASSNTPHTVTGEPIEHNKELTQEARLGSSDGESTQHDEKARHLDNSDQDPTTEGLKLQRTESQFEYPPQAQVIVIMIALMLAIFLVALDRTIIATAIPSITNDFHSLDDIGWYGSAFLLTASCFQLLLGRIFTFYTPKYVFLVVIIIFEIGSAICGAAPNSVAFIIGRAIAGLGSAGIMSGGVILLTDTVPIAKRPLYQGLFGAVFGVSSVVAPLLGGALTSNVTWRWCFYINLPIGAVVLAILTFILKPNGAKKANTPLKEQFLQLDPLGTLFLLPSIVCLLLALQWGGATYAWSDGRIIALWIVFAVAFIAFVAVQVFKNDTATIPAKVVKNRTVIAGMWLAFCLSSVMMIMVYYIAVWFQAIKGVSAVQSGIDTLPLVLSLVTGSISGGILTGRTGYFTIPAILSGIVMPIGAGMISTWGVDAGSNKWIGYQVIFGVGIGWGMQQGSLAAQTVLERQYVPTGVSLMFFMQTLGGAIFVSVGQNVLDSALIKNLVPLIPDAGPATIINTGATELRSIIPADLLPSVLLAYNDSLRQVFYVGVGMASAAILGAASLEWKSVKKAKDGKQRKSGQQGEKKSASTPDEQV